MSEQPLERGATEDRGYYNADYYDYYNGLGPYTRERWRPFFGQVADGIIADARPRTAIEFGCAKGFLVEALRERGVDAWGIDFSPYAIAAAHETVRPFVRVGDVREPVARRYDVAVCMEVLEHLDARDAAAAVRTLAAAADTVYFSSNPDEEFPEATHANVQPAAYWEELFARAGMVRDRDFAPDFIAPWALKFARPPVDAAGLVDIIVPVYNSPKHLRWCVESLYRHTAPARFRLHLVDDASDDYTKRVIAALAAAHSNVDVLANETNGGYVRAANRGLAASDAPFVVLLNSDVIVTAGWLDRLLAAARADPAVGLACPLSNRGENLTVAMPPGYSYADTAGAIAARGRRYPDAVTVVGYCLLLTRRLLDLVGPFDPIFAPGYVEEADYQFRATAAGFRAVVVDDCYVYHARGASFGDRLPHERRNWPIFEARWGAAYRAALADFEAADPLGALREAGTRALLDPPELVYDVVYYLPPTGAGVGGMISVVELVNRLILQGRRAMVATVGPWQIDCECLFTPLCYDREEDFLAAPPRAKVLVATGYQTVETVVRVCRAYGSVPAYFIQDYEGYFANGVNLSAVALTYGEIPDRIAVSGWVGGLLREQHDCDSTVIPLGVAVDEFYPRAVSLPDLAALRRAGHFLVFAMLRGDDRRGAPYLLEAARRLRERCPEVTFVFAGRYADGREEHGRYPLPDLPNVLGVGLLDRRAMARHLAACDVAVDASLYQGFGMLGIEALASGTAAVLTRTGGALEYAADGENCLLVEPRDVRGLCEAITRLRDDPALLRRLATAGRDTAVRFDWADLAARHAAFLAPLQAGVRLDAARFARRPRTAANGSVPPAPAAGAAPPALRLVLRGVRDGERLYTTEPGELARAGYRPQGLAFALYPEGGDGRLPLHRCFHRRSGDHLYTTDPEEGRRAGYRDEGVLGYLDATQRAGTRPLHRWRHPRRGDHLYSLDPQEGARGGYRFEGITGFVPAIPEGAAAPAPGPAGTAAGRAPLRRAASRLARAAYALAGNARRPRAGR